MDHLPHGEYPLDLKIPYICKKPYNHEKEWLEYPATEGFNLDHLRHHLFHYYSHDILPAFLQSWLYFGLLFAVLPFKPDVGDLLKDDEKGGKFITTSKLPMIFERWKQHARQLSKEEKLSSWRKNVLVLKDAHRTISYIADWPQSMLLSISPIPPVSREMALSFAILGRALELANTRILNPEVQEDLLGWSDGSLLLESMEAQGWCPFLVAGLAHVIRIDGIYFASTIGPPRVRRNHRKCTDEKCMYKSDGIQHVTPTCQCSMFSPDIDKIKQLLRENKLPLVRFVIGQNDKGGKLEVVPGEDGTKYVAMSHVWNDGLGNFAGNDMPACQLRRIQKAVDGLYRDEHAAEDSNITSIPFWMDTLLIPNDPKLEEIKDATIVHMTEIYKKAKDVLVIDSEVATCSLTSDSQSVLHRILLSNWLRRLWTLQEGVFAESIHFLMSDGTTSLGALMYDQHGAESCAGVGIRMASINHFIYRFGRALGQDSKSVLLNPSDPEDIRDDDLSIIQLRLSPEEQIWRRWDNERAIMRVIEAVATRVSTFDSDEALCIALLLDIDAKEIIAAKNRLKAREELEKTHPEYFKSPQARDEKIKLENEPMLILLRMLDGSIPPGVMLLTGPYHDTCGFRWAPKSFLHGPRDLGTLLRYPISIPQEYPSNELLDRHPSSLCDGGGGLRVVFPGLRLGHVKENYSLEKRFIVDTLPLVDLNVKDEIVEGKPPRVWQVLYSYDLGDLPWADVAPNWQNSSSIGIIICSYKRQWRENTTRGLMVRLKEEVVERGVTSIHAERICRVLITGAPDYDDQSWIKEPEKRVSGSWLPMTQQWCVD
ncbi:hypothetical protein N431DRAFT_501088 [Stipitochalara longipes BDJ]|nr:hypothetical protein N431DRAFT_501088 [Stipitochalara longipes BDJ]